jgi:hypothetical protein
MPFSLWNSRPKMSTTSRGRKRFAVTTLKKSLHADLPIRQHREHTEVDLEVDDERDAVYAVSAKLRPPAARPRGSNQPLAEGPGPYNGSVREPRARRCRAGHRLR